MMVERGIDGLHEAGEEDREWLKNQFYLQTVANKKKKMTTNIDNNKVKIHLLIPSTV
jgi:hypothetical protein